MTRPGDRVKCKVRSANARRPCRPGRRLQNVSGTSAGCQGVSQEAVSIPRGRAHGIGDGAMAMCAPRERPGQRARRTPMAPPRPCALPKRAAPLIASPLRRRGRVAEGGALLKRCTPKGYRRFESSRLRQTSFGFALFFAIDVSPPYIPPKRPLSAFATLRCVVSLPTSRW